MSDNDLKGWKDKYRVILHGYHQATDMHRAWPQQTELAAVGRLRSSVLTGETACMRLEGSKQSA